MQIFQTKTHAAVFTEMIDDARIVPLDNRPALDPELKQWSGDSRGHWEGNTLVVETRNFTDKTQSFLGARLTENTEFGSDQASLLCSVFFVYLVRNSDPDKSAQRAAGEEALAEQATLAADE